LNNIVTPLKQPLKNVPLVRSKAYVTTLEVIGVCDVMVEGFDKPLAITVTAIKDRVTNQYRSFDVKVEAPTAMKARFRRRMPVSDTIVVP
jgi:hypothetical protein